MGEITIELYWKHAPNTCRNFAELVRRGYYNGTVFHRIIRDFMIQGGDRKYTRKTSFDARNDWISLVFVTATGTGRGGSSIYGQTFSDEIHPDLRHTGAGILVSDQLVLFTFSHILHAIIFLLQSMANSGPDTNGSQFFITLAPTQWLDGKHAIFGRIHSGMQIVRRLGLVETDKNDRPIDTVKIVKGRVEKF